MKTTKRRVLIRFYLADDDPLADYLELACKTISKGHPWATAAVNALIAESDRLTCLRNAKPDQETI